MTIKFFPERKLVATDNVTYVPYVADNGWVGYRCEPTDGVGEVTYIYLNASGSTDDGVPTVFLYQGTENDPAQDAAQHHYEIRDSDVEDITGSRAFGSVHLLYGAKDKKTAHAVGFMNNRYEIVKCANCAEPIEAYEPHRVLENNKHTHFACPSERAHSN